jgi:hypothetical protein
LQQTLTFARCAFSLLSSHYQTELGLANEALSNEFVGGGLLAQAQMPFFG